MRNLFSVVAILVLIGSFANGSVLIGLNSSEQKDHGSKQKDHSMHGMESSKEEPEIASLFLLRLASDTSLNPKTGRLPMGMAKIGQWQAMWMGKAFLDYTYQSGQRGGESVFSLNNGMFGVARQLGSGALMFRSMLSFEPMTVRNRLYPLLFQTGEMAYGKPIVDGQHPHDLFMEVGVHYAYRLSDSIMLQGYYAPVGGAALGPPAFPHRASAVYLPQATRGHHWQDSTHIANQVVTGAIAYNKFRWELSGFHGQEPDEDRWDIDAGPIDSFSTRFSFTPNPNWVGQFSIGRLHQPERMHITDIRRTTASVQHSRDLGRGEAWSTAFIWGQNYKLAESKATNAFLIETVFPLGTSRFLTGRFEWSQRDELLDGHEGHSGEHDEHSENGVFDITSFTAGMTQNLGVSAGFITRVGMNLTAHRIPDALKQVYGSKPYGFHFFLSLTLGTPMRH